MIELVFVIVVLGILAAVAVPKFTATRIDAQITKGRSDVAAIRSAIINERQSRLFRGQPAFLTTLDSGGGQLFDGNGSNGLLQYPITPSATAGHWSKLANNQYRYMVGGSTGNADFTYTPGTGTFNCAASTACTKLTR